VGVEVALSFLGARLLQPALGLRTPMREPFLFRTPFLLLSVHLFAHPAQIDDLSHFPRIQLPCCAQVL
jgi:hypothetical protein